MVDISIVIPSWQDEPELRKHLPELLASESTREIAESGNGGASRYLIVRLYDQRFAVAHLLEAREKASPAPSAPELDLPR